LAFREKGDRFCLTLIINTMDRKNGTAVLPAGVDFSYPAGETLFVHLRGSWKIGAGAPSPEAVARQIREHPEVRSVRFDSAGLQSWDSSLPAFISGVREKAGAQGVGTILEGLPQGAVRLLNIAAESKQLERLAGAEAKMSLVAAIGSRTAGIAGFTVEMVRFIGEASLAFMNLFRGRARFRRSELGLLIYECGVQALPIVSLISILVGLILGFVGTIELEKFGAQIFIADLVGISMAREMGAMMTAIIMMGRTGAAFATQLGTMVTNEELDALKTLGLSPMEFLVMPRMLALVLMVPLLCVYADIMGIAGGALVGVTVAGIPYAQYYNESVTALTVTEFAIGIVKSMVYAVLIGLSGCFYGIHADRSAMAVGYAATRAVVTGIVLIVVADGIFAVETSILDI